jgi:hypothetical protein
MKGHYLQSNKLNKSILENMASRDYFKATFRKYAYATSVLSVVCESLPPY